jgi:uncharacterized protein (TIGR00266 family)
MAQLYYAGPNRQPLPVNDDVVDSLLSIGSLTPDSLVWQEGMTEWLPLKKVRPDLLKSSPPALPSGPPALPQAPAYCRPAPMAGRSHEIDYKIMGDDMQIVEIELDPGETVVAEAGSMNYMESGIQFETKMGDGSNPNSGFFDKLKSVGKRMLTGESLFMTHFTNRAAGKQSVAFAAPYPGKIIPLELSQYNGELFCQKDAFLCAAFGTKVGIAFAKKLGVGFFGGEGFILQRLNGDGKAFIHAGGTIVKRELTGQTLLVDTGCLVAFTQGINYDIQRAGNMKSMVFGGEGLFLATLSGHGTVWLQSLPFSRLADRVLANARGTASNDSGSVLGGLGNLFGD